MLLFAYILIISTQIFKIFTFFYQVIILLTRGQKCVRTKVFIFNMNWAFSLLSFKILSFSTLTKILGKHITLSFILDILMTHYIDLSVYCHIATIWNITYAISFQTFATQYYELSLSSITMAQTEVPAQLRPGLCNNKVWLWG